MKNTDKAFAEELCNKEKDAVKHFQSLYSDELYFVASKLANIGIQEDSWSYRTKKGYDIKVDDVVSDTYLWLVHQVQVKSCLYKGLSEFKNYILTVLNSSYMKKDWLKWKTGVTGYIPKHITKMGKRFEDVYKLLRQKKDDSIIIRKLEIDELDLIDIKNDIYKSLIKHDQLDLVENITISSLSMANEDGDIIFEPEDKNLNSYQKNMFNISIDEIDKIVSSFKESEKRIAIAYWGKGLSAEQIFNFLNKDAPKILVECGIQSVSDIYKFVTSFIDKFYNKINENEFLNSVIVESNFSQTKKGARTIIENYYLLKK